MEQQGPIQLTTKNPKKVEQGKKLAAYDRKNREKLKQLEMNEVKSKESKTFDCSNYYSTGAVVGVILLVFVGYYVYSILRKVKK